MCTGVSALDSLNEASNASHKRCNVPRCQVLGCSTDLTDAKLYCQRKLVCPEHMAAEAVQVTGSQQLFRFCFQCGKLEELASFDSKKRSCRRRLELRRNSPRNKKGDKSRSKPSSAAAAADADAWIAAADSFGESLDRSMADYPAAVGNAAAAASGEPRMWTAAPERSSSYSDSPSVQLQQTGSSQLAAPADTASGSSCSSEQRAWNAVQPRGGACAPFQHAGSCPQPHLGGFAQLVPQAPAASAAVCWQQHSSTYPAAPAAAATAPAATAMAPAFDGLQLPHFEDLISEGVSDADSLQWVLESELTAAALGAAIAHRGSVAMAPDDKQLSQHLAAVLVEDSGLFGPSQIPAQAPMQHHQHGQHDGACRAMSLGPPMHPGAPALYSQHSVASSSMQSCSSGITDCGATPGPAGMPGCCWGATGVLGSCMPYAGQLLAAMPAASACSGNAMPAQAAPAVPACFVQPGAQFAGPAGAVNMAGLGGCSAAAAAAGPSMLLADQAARLTQLRLQMADLQSRVAQLKQQFGL